MRISRRVTGCFGVLTLVAAFGCSENSPGAVAERFVTLANDGKCSDAYELVSTESKEAVARGLGVLTGGFNALCNAAGRNGMIAEVELLEEQVRGEFANVRMRIKGKNGGIEERNAQLIKQNGAWKVFLASSQEEATAQSALAKPVHEAGRR